MNANSRTRVSAEQLDTMLKFMEQHRRLAAGRQQLDDPGVHQVNPVQARYSTNKLWRMLAEKLNACEDGVRKSPDKWCRYWADLKYKSKKKSSGQNSLDHLSDIEQRITNIVGVGVREYGSKQHNQSDGEDRKPNLNADESMEGEADPIEQINLSQSFGEPKLSTEELLAEAAMRSALAAEKQAEAVTQGVELLREFLTTFRQDITALQNIAHSILDRDRPVP